MNVPRVSLYSKISQILFWILHSAQTGSLSRGHPVIFFLSSVIIPFPLRERKDRNNPAEIYGSPGAKLLCRSKLKTRAAVADTLRDLEFHGPVGFGPRTWTQLII